MFKRTALAAVLCSILVSLSAGAATFVVPTDRALVEKSNAIIRGVVLSSHPEFTDSGAIVTVTDVSVHEVLKGRPGKDIVQVYAPGGHIGDRMTIIPGAARFEPGAEVLLFLNGATDKGWGVTDLVLGKFEFRTDVEGQQLLVRQEGDIVGWTTSGSVHSEKRRDQSEFLSFVRKTVAGQAAVEDYFVPQANLRPMSAHAIVQPTSTPSTYTMADNESDFGIRWQTFGAGITWVKQNSASGDAGGGNTAITKAMTSWTDDVNSAVQMSFAGTVDATATGGVLTPDGKNAFRFDVNFTGSPFFVPAYSCGSGGVIAIGGGTNISGSLHSHPTTPSDQFYAIAEGDVDVNQGFAACASSWNTGLANTAFVHEVGHALGFRHSNQNRVGNGACPVSYQCENVSAIMLSTAVGGLNGNLQAYDMAAVQALYPITACIGSLNAQSVDVTSSAGSGSVNVTSSCSWTAVSNSAFINVTGGAAGSNNGTVNYSYTANATGSPRSGTITIAGQTFTVNQAAAACVYNIASSEASVGSAAGSGSLGVTAGNGCAWTATSNSAFINITGGTPGSGNGNVLFSWTQNAGGARTGTITAAGKTFTLNQAAGGVVCSYSLNPTARSHSKLSATGQTVTVTATTGCAWTAVSNSAFVTVTGGASGNGNGVVTYSVAANPGAVRTGTITIAGQTFTVGQAGAVVRGDFNTDGKPDLIWRNTSTGANRFWYLNGIANLTQPALPTVPDQNYKIGGFGDFNGDGYQDIVWRNQSTTAMTIWYMNGTNLLSSADTGTAYTPWWLVSVHDINSDGKPDYMWRNMTTGENTAWLMNNTSMIGGLNMPTAYLTYDFGGAGDFNADGTPDLIWKNTSTGEIVVWYMNSTGGLVSSGGLGNLYPAWKIVVVGDYNNDGYNDLIFRNVNNGQNIIWYYQNGLWIGGADLAPDGDLNWTIAGPR